MRIFLCEQGKVTELEVIKETEKQIKVRERFFQYTLKKAELPKSNDYTQTDTDIRVFAETEEEAKRVYLELINKKIFSLEEIVTKLKEYTSII